MYIACTHRRIAYCVHALITQEHAYRANALIHIVHSIALMHTVQRQMHIVHNLLCILYNAVLHIVQMLRCILCKHCDLNCANAVMQTVQRQMHIVRTNSRRTHTDGR